MNWLTIRQVHSDVSVGTATMFTTQPGALVAVPYASELYDDHDRFNPATHRYTAPTAGDYEICAAIGDPALANALELDTSRGGTHDKTLSLRRFAPAGCRVVRAAAGDTLEIQAFINSTATAYSVPSNAIWDQLTIRAIP